MSDLYYYRLYLVHQDKKDLRVRFFAISDMFHPDNIVVFKDILSRAAQEAWWKLNKQETGFTFQVERPYSKKRYKRIVVGVVEVEFHPHKDPLDQVEIREMNFIGYDFKNIEDAFKIFEKGKMIQDLTIYPKGKWDSTKVPVWDINPITSYVKPPRDKYPVIERSSFEKPMNPMYPRRVLSLTTKA